MRPLGLRFLRLLAGLFLYALGIVITIRANIGYAPWDVFHAGLSRSTGLSMGRASILAGLCIVALVTIMRERIGLGTLLNMLLIGLFMDLILESGLIPQASNWPLGLLEMIAGLFVISLASFFYIGSGFGAGPRDSLMVLLTRLTKWPVGLIRALIEIGVTDIGWLLGGLAGLGTLVAGLAVGVSIQITFRLLRFDPTQVRHEDFRESARAIAGLFRR